MSDASFVVCDGISTEDFDDEIMIVNLGTGSYYSLSGPAAEIWALVGEGHDLAAIAAEIEQRYGAEASDAGDACRSFVDELVAEALIERAEAKAPAPPIAAARKPGAYAAPVLEKYTDMQELLLIDPIHEVNDEHGWPKMKPDS